jgi:hypothetical protein
MKEVNLSTDRSNPAVIVTFIFGLCLVLCVAMNEFREYTESKNALMFRAMELQYNGALDIDDLLGGNIDK